MLGEPMGKSYLKAGAETSPEPHRFSRNTSTTQPDATRPLAMSALWNSRGSPQRLKPSVHETGSSSAPSHRGCRAASAGGSRSVPRRRGLSPSGPPWLRLGTRSRAACRRRPVPAHPGCHRGTPAATVDPMLRIGCIAVGYQGRSQGLCVPILADGPGCSLRSPPRPVSKAPATVPPNQTLPHTPFAGYRAFLTAGLGRHPGNTGSFICTAAGRLAAVQWVKSFLVIFFKKERPSF